MTDLSNVLPGVPNIGIGMRNCRENSWHGTNWSKTRTPIRFGFV